MTTPTAHANGLARWRERQAAEKRVKMEELDFYRLFSTTEVYDGKTFTVVRIPDMYDLAWKKGRAA